MALKIKCDVGYILERKSTPDEEKTLGSKRVIDPVSLDDLKDLDPGQDYKLIAAIPKEVPVKKGPVKNIQELTPEKKIKDELELALFNEMKKVLTDTYKIKYKTQKNEEKEGSLLSSIQKTFKKYLIEYRSVRSKDGVIYLDANDKYWVIFAIADIINKEKVGGENLSDIFVKLQQEGEIKWAGIDSRSRTKAQMLAYRKLSKYNPYKSGWDLPKFKSFNEFNQAISDLIQNSIEKYKQREQPTLILEMAYEILESKKRHLYTKN